MKGTINIPVGRYELTDGLSFTVRTSDAGTVVTISSTNLSLLQTAVIDERGQIVGMSGQSEGVSPMAVLHAVLRTGPLEAALLPQRLPPKDKGRTRRLPNRVKFVMQYAKELRWPKNHAFVLGGFSDGTAVHVLYRVILGEMQCQQNQLRVDGEKIIFAAQIPKGQRLPQARFNEVCRLPEQATFKLGRKRFRRMSLAELGPLLKGKTLRIGSDKSG